MRRALFFSSAARNFIPFYISISDHNQSTKETKDTSPYSRMWLSDHCDLLLIFIRAAVGTLDCYFAWHERRAGGKVQPRLIRAGAALWLTFYTLVPARARLRLLYIMWDFVSANNKRVHIDRRGEGVRRGLEAAVGHWFSQWPTNLITEPTLMSTCQNAALWKRTRKRKVERKAKPTLKHACSLDRSVLFSLASRRWISWKGERV